MGHSSSISLGIAIAKQDRPVYCLDGDGAFIMHLGQLVTLAIYLLKTIIIFCLTMVLTSL